MRLPASSAGSALVSGNTLRNIASQFPCPAIVPKNLNIYSPAVLREATAQRMSDCSAYEIKVTAC